MEEWESCICALHDKKSLPDLCGAQFSMQFSAEYDFFELPQSRIFVFFESRKRIKFWGNIANLIEEKIQKVA